MELAWRETQMTLRTDLVRLGQPTGELGVHLVRTVQREGMQHVAR